MRARPFAILVAVGVLFRPSPAAAVTVDQIVAMTKAGVSEAVILSVIERDRTILTLEPEQIVALKRDGVSDEIVIAMLKSGREEGEAAVRAEAAWNAASIIAGLSTSPDLLIIGHGPDRPNVSAGGGFGSFGVKHRHRSVAELYGEDVGAYADVPVVVPYLVPLFETRGTRAPHRRVSQASVPPVESGAPVTPSLPPSSFVAVPPDTSPKGMFFNDGGGPARGIFFSPR